MDAQQKLILDTLEKIIIEVQSYHIDWAAINAYSPDYNENYKPIFPTIVYSATNAKLALIEMWKDK